MNVPTEKEMNVFQKYFKECVLLGLVSVVVYLFLSFQELQLFVRNDLINDKAILIKTVEQNTAVLKDINKQNKKEFNDERNNN